MKRNILCSLFAILLSVSGQARASDWFPVAVIFTIATSVGTAAVKSIAAAVTSDEGKTSAAVPVEPSANQSISVEAVESGKTSESEVIQAPPVDVMAEVQKRYEVLNPQLEKIADEQNTVGNAVVSAVGRVAAGRMISDSAAASAMFSKRFR